MEFLDFNSILDACWTAPGYILGRFWMFFIVFLVRDPYRKVELFKLHLLASEPGL